MNEQRDTIEYRPPRPLFSWLPVLAGTLIGAAVAAVVTSTVFLVYFVPKPKPEQQQHQEASSATDTNNAIVPSGWPRNVPANNPAD
jgi:hypothetical protein